MLASGSTCREVSKTALQPLEEPLRILHLPLLVWLGVRLPAVGCPLTGSGDPLVHFRKWGPDPHPAGVDTQLTLNSCIKSGLCWHKIPSFSCTTSPPVYLNGYPLGSRGFLGSTGGKEPACQCRRHKRCGLDPWVRKIPWRRARQPTAAFLPAESHGQRSPAGYSPRRRRESETTEHTRTSGSRASQLGSASPGYD